jgi:signal transduction histidine kinase
MAIPWPQPTVRLRLALTYTAMFVVTGVALLGVSYILIQHREKGPATAAQIICQRSVTGGPGPSGNASGVISGAPGNLALDPTNCLGVVGTYFHSTSSGSASSESGGVAVPVQISGGQQVKQLTGPTAAAIRQLTAAVSASQEHTLDSFKLESAIALGLITILSFGLSWWMAGRALQPVHRITDAARRLSEQTLHSRINLKGPNDELKELADTFDAMLARLDRAFTSQRRFVANASHELRTPLATERVLIDEALANRSVRPEDFRAILEELRANSEETERLIDALLVLARSERGIERWSDVDLAAAAETALVVAAPEAAQKGIQVRSDLTPLIVKGDRGLLERLIGNVVENGIRHNFAGGWVNIALTGTGPSALLEVTNSGPTLDGATIDTLTEPFRRGDRDRSSDDGGFGLGLSVVDSITNAHSGAMTLRARPGGGLILQIKLPVVIGTNAPSHL